MHRTDGLASDLRTPTAAAVAGIIFSGVLIAVVVLIRTSVPAAGGPGSWAADPQRRAAVGTAVSLIPFAGISFLWFIGVVRSRLADREDRLFATVFLGSGLLFVALLFVAASLLGTLLVLFERGVPVEADAMAALQVLTNQLMGSFGARMAAVFTFAVTSVGLRARIIPRWLVLVGYVSGLLLLASPPLTHWMQLLFPTWVLVVSLHILATGRRAGTAQPGDRTGSVGG